MQGDSAAIIIATIGKITLRRAIDSALNQTHDNLRVIVVIDGPDYRNKAAWITDTYSSNPQVEVLTLPQNTGGGGYVCHRIYGYVPGLINQDYVFYLDDDNWLEGDHVYSHVKACIENNLDWSFSFRNIWHNGEYLCQDACESVGLWPVWYDPSFVHIDTNCFCLRREIAIRLAPRWHKSRLKDGQIQPSADTEIANYLRRAVPRHALVPKYTVNYELGSTALSPKPDFFLDGNIQFLQQHGGRLPWLTH